jgi:RNA polymerase sigma factor (sigma-70 family)
VTTSHLRPAKPAATVEDLVAVVRAEHRKMILHYVRLGYGLQDAQDAVQEAVTAALSQIMKSDKPITALKAWLYEVGRREAFKKAKKEREDREEAAHCHPDYEVRRNTDIIDDPRIPALERSLELAIRELPPRRREILSLSLTGLSEPEIAQVAGIAEASVRSHLRHARDSLRRMLSE